MKLKLLFFGLLLISTSICVLGEHNLVNRYNMDCQNSPMDVCRQCCHKIGLSYSKTNLLPGVNKCRCSLRSSSSESRKTSKVSVEDKISKYVLEDNLS